MLHNLKKNLFEILNKIDKNIIINIDDIEVETLFDQRGDFTTNTAPVSYTHLTLPTISRV